MAAKPREKHICECLETLYILGSPFLNTQDWFVSHFHLDSLNTSRTNPVLTNPERDLMTSVAECMKIKDSFVWQIIFLK